MQPDLFPQEDTIFLPRDNSLSDVAYTFFGIDGRTLNFKDRHRILNRDLRLSNDEKEKTKIRKDLKYLKKEIRKSLYNTDIMQSQLKYLVRCYKNWMREPLYLQFDNEESGESEFHLACKRGNSTYRKQVLKTLEEHTAFMDEKSFEKFMLNDRRTKTKTLFLTLTWNPNIFLGSRNRAWLSLLYYYNRFISRMRKKYGKIFAIRGTESTKAGYPHLHLLLVFKDKEFNVFKHGKTYRIKEKEEIAKMWNHFVDVEVPVNLHALKTYIFKDIIKQYSRTNRRTDQDFLSLALCWIYRIQSYSISGFDSDLIRVSIIQTQLKDILEKSKQKLIFKGLVVINFSFPYLKDHKPPDYFRVKLGESKLSDLEVHRIREPRNKICLIQ